MEHYASASALPGTDSRTARTPGPLRAYMTLHAPKLVLAPTLIASVLFVYGFILLTGYLSLTDSHLLPRYEFVGLLQYRELFDNERWWLSLKNLGIFGALFIGASVAIGLALAILLDQKIRADGALRAIYLYPMALSLIVTGTAWKWMLNPSMGLEKTIHELGWTSFQFDWLVNPEMVIYTVVIAGVWQSSGFVMALFLAGLRGIDEDIIKAAQMDGASLPLIYRRIIIPALRPVFFSVLLILAHIAIKSFDLVIALTAGGPGNASSIPAIFMYQFSFTRGQLGLGSAAAMMMFATVVAVLVPMMYLEVRSRRELA